MPGILYVVATPIGNLEDITLRAVRILREVALIAAEDTRRTARLLQHYSISTPTTSLHQHNERQRTRALLSRLQAGESIALVSDAGTPTLSDPGAELVRAVREAGVRVEPIPGPSAVMAALSASGISDPAFVFVGFPPSRSSARKAWLTELKDDRRPLIVYEAPHRLTRSLADMLLVLGDRRVVVARELTKRHEEFVECHISEVAERLGALLGEITLIVLPQTAHEVGYSTESHGSLRRDYDHFRGEGGLGPREAAREVARRHGLKTRDVYRLVHQDP